MIHRGVITKLKNLQDINKDLQGLDLLNPFEICPFRIILGEINSTNSGYRSDYSTPNNYSYFSQVFTGRNSILAIWENSYTAVEQNNPSNVFTAEELREGNSENNVKMWNGKKKFKIGTVINGYIQSSTLTANITANAQNQVENQTSRAYEFTVIYNDANKDFIDNLQKYYFMLYMLPRNNIEYSTNQFINNGNKTNPFIATDRSLYRIQGVLIIREQAAKDQKTRPIAYINISFISVNDTFLKSGLALKQFVQFGGVGEKSAIPTINKDGFIDLDNDYLNMKPCNYAQITFYGNNVLNNIVFYGRPVYKETIGDNRTERIYAPRLIIPLEYQGAIYDKLSYASLPMNNYYWISTEFTIDTYYDSWRKSFIADFNPYNELQQKTFIGHFRTNSKDVRKTNPTLNYIDTAATHHLSFWEPTFSNKTTMTDILTNHKPTDISSNKYFNYSDINGNILYSSYTAASFDYKELIKEGNGELNLSTMNLFNHFVNNTIYQLPLNIRQTTMISLASLPIIGGFLNRLTGGIPFGFKIKGATLPNINFFFGLIECSTYDRMVDIFYNDYHPLGILTMNIIDSKDTSTINHYLGIANNTISFCFSLTDTIKNVDFYTGLGESIGVEDTISTVLLNQQLIYSKTAPNNIKGSYLVNDNTRPTIADEQIEGYIIDQYFFQQLGNANYRVIFFSSDYEKVNGKQVINGISLGASIYTATYETFSNRTENIRLWTETKNLSNPLFNFNETFKWPETIHLPNQSNPNTLKIDIDMNQLAQGKQAVYKIAEDEEVRDTIDWIHHTDKGGTIHYYAKNLTAEEGVLSALETTNGFSKTPNEDFYYNYDNTPTLPDILDQNRTFIRLPFVGNTSIINYELVDTTLDKADFKDFNPLTDIISLTLTLSVNTNFLIKMCISQFNKTEKHLLIVNITQ